LNNLCVCPVNSISKMLTERETNVLKRCSQIFGKYVGIPFRWNSKDGEMIIKSKPNIYFKILLWFLILLKLFTNFHQLRVLSQMGDMDSLFIHAYLSGVSGGHIIFRLFISFQKQEWADLNNELSLSNKIWGKPNYISYNSL